MSQRKLGDWLEGFLAYNEVEESPVVYFKWVGLSVIAAALQRRCYMQWETKVYPNMFIILVGPAGGPRKTTAMRPGKILMSNEPTIKLSADSITREKLIRRMAEVSEIEQLSDGAVLKHSSFTVCSSEFTVFLGYKNEQFLADLTDLYDCADSWIYDTKGSGTDEIVGVCLNVLGATTPEHLQHALPVISIGGGLTSRFMYIYAEDKEKIIPFPFKTPDEQQLFEDLQHDLSVITQMNGQFLPTSDYLKLIGEWYVEAEKRPYILDPKFWAYNSRRRTHLVKVGMCMSASRDNNMLLDEEIFHKSLSWLKEAERKMERTYRGYGKKEYASVMPQVLRMIKQSGEIRFTELMCGTFQDLDTLELKSILETFRLKKYITMESTDNGKDFIIRRTDVEY